MVNNVVFIAITVVGIAKALHFFFNVSSYLHRMTNTVADVWVACTFRYTAIHKLLVSFP